MGFLSNLFKRPDAQPTNSARAEIEKRMEAVSAGKAPIGELLFMGVVGVSKFFRPVFAFPDPEKERRYLSDHVLYELAMFRIFGADHYIIRKHPDLRGRLGEFLRRQTAMLFGPCLGINGNEIIRIVDDRTDFYDDIFLKVGDPVVNLMALRDCILDTAANGAVRSGKQVADLGPTDALDRFTLDAGLTAWETNFLPVVCDTIDEVAKLSR